MEIDAESQELQLKVLKRFRKIFLSRNIWLETLNSGEVSEQQKNWFLKLLSANEFNNREEVSSPANMTYSPKPDLSQEFNDKQKEAWFNFTDKESFRAEAAQLLKCSPLEDAYAIKKDILKFEESFSGVGEDSYSHLYFHKYLDGVIAERALSRDGYESLRKSFHNNFPAAVNVDTPKAIERLREFIHREFFFIFSPQEESAQEQSNDKDNEARIKHFMSLLENMECAYFIKYISDEFKRRILNAYFSVMIGVNPTEEVPFVKTNGGNIDYAAFRILVWLRNPNFDFKDFWYFLSKIEPHALPERMIVDNGLPEVVKLFIRKVVKPERVDNLIITHRIVKGLWQNGSKFMNSYTLHNEEHAVKLIMLSMEIIRRIDYFQLKQLDYYILFLACYLHDISMVIHPDLQQFSHAEERNVEVMEHYLDEMSCKVDEWKELIKRSGSPEKFVNFWKSFGVKMTEIFSEIYEFFESDVRKKHPIKSALFIKNKRHDLFQYLEETIVEAVVKTGEDHGKEIHNVYDLRSSAKDDVVSTKYVSILLRLADLMDVSNDRINYHLLKENVSHLSAVSKFHWISHLITDEISLIPDYKIREIPIPVGNGKILNHIDIREILRFYLVLNMKSLEPIERTEDCNCRDWHVTAYTTHNVPLKYKDYEGITLHFEDKPCKETACPMICRWVNNKHSWLFPELARLQKYLNTVNYEPFITEIEVNILFKDFSDINLKPSLFDDVRRYLKKEHNE